MSEFLIFAKGAVLGFSIAAPVGPIGVLCIRRTLAHGALTGFVSGLGTAAADALYGCIAAFGLTAVSSWLLSGQFALRLFGGLFLLYLGITTFRARPASTAAKADGKGLAGAFASAFVLTLTNPMTILSFAAVLAGLGLGSFSGDFRLAGIMVAGVFFGSLAWWWLLSGIVSRMRSTFDAQRMKWVNQISGTIIIGFGMWSLLSI